MPMPRNRGFGYSKAAAALFEPFPLKKEATDQVAFPFLAFSCTEQKK